MYIKLLKYLTTECNSNWHRLIEHLESLDEEHFERACSLCGPILKTWTIERPYPWPKFLDRERHPGYDRFANVLNLSDEDLNEIPKEVFELKNLEELNLSWNQIKTVPEEIQKLTALRRLDITHNLIVGIPSFLLKIENLKIYN